jgi:hypothetical protein
MVLSKQYVISSLYISEELEGYVLGMKWYIKGGHIINMKHVILSSYLQRNKLALRTP